MTVNRTILIALFDLLAVLAAWGGGFLLRFNFDIPQGYGWKFVTGLLILTVFHGMACRVAGLYRGMWVFASLPDLKRVLKAVAVSSIALLVVLSVDRSVPSVPRSMILLYPLLLIAVMGGGRAVWRMWKEHSLYGDLRATGNPVVVVGAGTAGAMLVRELERSPDWRVVALVDDNKGTQGRDLYGYPIAGHVKDIEAVLKQYKSQHVILAMPSAPALVRRRVADLAMRAGAQVFIVPRLEDLMGGKVAINTMRPLEIIDLLGREAISIDSDHVQHMVEGKTVLVTGAGGSIGSELSRQLARFSPKRLVLFDSGEFVLYTIEQWFAQQRPDVDIVPVIGDVRDAPRVEEIFSRFNPELVFHAAAYKHVPLMERHNAWQSVSNNVRGTLVVARAAQAMDAERFVLVSTDKAVNPTNVMGATKRLAEMVCQALQASGGKTQFEIVRFGNVLGSTGSVIPKFQEQIAHGGPVTVTHPEINRFFMSIPEAAQLVLQAASMGRGGEIFVMEMGEPVKIVDLAKNMIRLSGYTEDEIQIQFTGLRPGEKLYEELLANTEHTRETPHPKLRIARSRPVDVDLLPILVKWLSKSGVLDDERVRDELRQWVPEYQPAAPAKAELTLVHDRANERSKLSQA